ncbi:DsbA family oxidoreductase [Paenibacillus harenae]|uniref:DsbA family oxidoreductase n=1 Tax=Paenibacillus harenae TaxID=306543 RepID=UPI002793F208|nr:DsbA family oxidoreductase [Paenibacillus harenae]MDQ0057971.1 putative DsbA family dithiol-disulfide isomerase [Paenibacillus harenae]
MKVEIWSDYVCPFCYIGKRRFELGLSKFEHNDKIEVVYRSFELDPGADAESGKSTYEMLSKKYGMTIEQAKANTVNVAQQAAEVGLTFNFDGQVETNTFDSHRLMHFAASQGKDKELSERLFKAHFTDNDNVGNREKLAQLAAEVGLDAEAATKVLASDVYADAVRGEENEGSTLGIRGVPYYVFDRKYAVSGAQAPETFLSTLKKAWDEKHPTLIQVDGDDDVSCADGVCAPDAGRSQRTE